MKAAAEAVEVAELGAHHDRHEAEAGFQWLVVEDGQFVLTDQVG